MTIYNVQSIFVFFGLLSLIGGMVALFEFKKLDISARYWVAASLLIGVTNIATVFRAELPLFVSYSLAIRGSVSAYFVMGFGIARLYTHRSAESDWLWILSVFVVYTAAMELCRQHTNPKVTLVISSLGLGLASLWCAIPAHRHYRLTGNRFSMHMRWVVIALAFVQIARTQSLLGTWSFQSFGQDLLSLSLWTSIYILGILRYCFYVAMRIQEYANEKAAVALIQVRTEESRRVAEQLAHLARQQSLSLMGASFSHELNQPLTATLNYAELAKSQILSGKADSAILVELMDYIIEHTVRISQIIRQIRNFISPSKYRSERVDMSRLIQDMCVLLDWELRHNRVHVIKPVNPTDCFVTGDSTQLSQVIVNVIQNAVQAMGTSDERTLSIDWFNDGSQVTLRVSDTGTGLSEDAALQYGEPFFTTKAQGTGLGLSICNTILAQYGGQLRLANNPSKGACATITLPCSSSSISPGA